MYLFDPEHNESITIEEGDNHIVSNIDVLKNAGAVVFWGNYASSWGANLDYDSWGGNQQPWADKGERVEISQTFSHLFHFSPSTDFTNILPPFSLFAFHFLKV